MRFMFYMVVLKRCVFSRLNAQHFYGACADDDIQFSKFTFWNNLATLLWYLFMVWMLFYYCAYLELINIEISTSDM